MNLTGMTLSQIARVVRADWTDPNYAAKPYLRALAELDSIDQAYGDGESARSVVLYFLGNASSWRGEMARAVKAELKGRLK